MAAAQVRPLAIVPIVLMAAPAPAASACHHYHQWYYPWPQNCRTTAFAPAMIRSRAKIAFVLPPERDDSLPLPSLTDIVWGTSLDEPVRQRWLLRASVFGKENE
jgi:hypothetical protein